MAVEVASLYGTIGANLDPLRKGLAEAKRGLGSIGQGFKSLGASAMKAGGVMSAGLTAPIVMLGKKGIGMAANFESQMNTLTIAARSSGTSLEDLRKSAIAVGADTELVGIDARQAAEAMENFYKAGLTTSDVFDDLGGYLKGTSSLSGALRAAIDMAAASELDLASASDVVSIAMATFGLSAKDATKITDNFVRAADASVTSVPELAEAMKNVGPTMAAFNVPLEDVNTALALLSQRGISGAEAGTNLKSMFTNMMRQTPKVTGMLKKLNISLYDQQGVMYSMPNILRQLEKGMAGLSDEQKNVAIQTLAGTYGMKAMNTLLAGGTKAWDDMEDAIGGAASAQSVAEQRTKGMGAAMEQLEGAVETLMIQALTPFMEDVLTPLVTKITEFAGKIINLDPKILALGVGFVALLAAAGPIVLAFGALSTILGAILSPIGLIVAGIVALGAAFVTSQGGIEPAIETLKDIKDGIVGVFKALTGDTGLDSLMNIGDALRTLGIPPETIENILGGLLEIGETVQETFGRVKEWGSGAWDEVKKAFEEGGLGEAIQTALGELGGLGDALEPMRTLISGKFTEFATNAWAAFSEAQPELAGVLEKVATAFSGLDFSGMWAGIQAAFEEGGLGAAIQTALGDVSTIATALEPLGTAISEKFTEFATNAWAAFSEAQPETAEGITGVLEGIGETIEKVKTWFSEAGEKIGEALGFIGDLLKETFGDTFTEAFASLQEAGEELSPLWDQMKETFATLLPVFQALGGLIGAIIVPILKVLGGIIGGAIVVNIGVLLAVFRGLIEGVSGALPFLVSAVQGAFKVIQGVLEFFTSLVQLIVGAVTGDTEKIAAAWEKMKESVVTIVTGLWDIVKNLFLGAIELVKGFVSGLVDGIIGFFTNLYDKLVGNSIVTDIVEGIKTAFTESLAEVITSVGGWVADMANKFLEGKDALVSAGKDLLDGLKKGIADKWGEIVGFLKGLAAKLPEPIKKALKISSPSEVFAAIGAAMIEGVGVGMSREEASVYEKLGDFVGNIINAFAQLMDMGAGGGGGAINVQGMIDWVNQLSQVLVYVIDKFQHIQNLFGYAKIKELQKTASRFKSIMGAILIDFSAVKEYEIPDLDWWFGLLLDAFRRAMALLNKIQEEFGVEAMRAAVAIVNDVKTVMKLLGTSLQIGEVSEGFAEGLGPWLEAAKLGSSKLIEMLGDLREEWGRKAIVRAGDIADDVSEVLGLLGASLAIEAPTADFADVLGSYLAGMIIAVNALIPLLDELRVTWGRKVLSKAAETAGKIKSVLDLLSIGKLFADITTVKELGEGEKKIPLVKAITGLLADLEAATELLKPAIERLRADWGDALEPAAEFAQLIGEFFKGIADAVKAAGAMVEEGLDVGKINALLAKFAQIQIPAMPALPAEAGTLPVPATAEGAGGTTAGGTGIIRVHIMSGEELMQVITLRIDELMQTMQDIYIEQGLEGNAG